MENENDKAGGGGDAVDSEESTTQDNQNVDALGEGESEDTPKRSATLPSTDFIDEDSVSRSSANTKDVVDEEAKETDNQGEKTTVEDEVSRDASSVQSAEALMEMDKGIERIAVMEDNQPTPTPSEGAGNKEKEIDLVSQETLNEDTNDGEDIVTEVDISSMMEVNFEEDDNSQNAQQPIEIMEEPEVIALDSDDDDVNATADNKSSNDAVPVISVAKSIFQIDEEENITEVDVNSEMEVDHEESQSSTSSGSRRPRRAAAEAAVKTIHRISVAEKKIAAQVFRNRRKSQEDADFDPDIEEISPPHPPAKQHSETKQNQCHVCKKHANCSIVVRQYGSDLHLCSNLCFNRFRNQGTDSKNKTLPCSKCGIMDGESANEITSNTFYWETMNFCSDLCVGRYQMDVGSKCCTCGVSVSWNSLGKYCVRFGSDIRQFCNPQCLEGYKKNARVCFNCQLDIRRIGNVILANIPSKNTPKEFCSNDCVEMYCDRNMHQPTRAKPLQEHPCFMCHVQRPVIRELILANGTFKTCSDSCWNSMLTMKGISKAEKCEMCTKFVNMDLGFTTPVYWLSSAARIYGFCSHVCKNLYILNSRKILSCISCKVKKYNFDLIEYYTCNTFNYAVCSLACLPKSPSYLKNIRDVIFLPQPTSDKTTPSSVSLGAGGSIPVISAVSGSNEPVPRPARQRRKQVYPTTNSKDAEVIEIDDDDDDDDDEFRNVVVKDSDNILDIFTMEELEEVLKFMRKPKTRNVCISAKPILKTVETQTDVSELNEMRRIPYYGDKDKSSSRINGKCDESDKTKEKHKSEEKKETDQKEKIEKRVLSRSSSSGEKDIEMEVEENSIQIVNDGDKQKHRQAKLSKNNCEDKPQDKTHTSTASTAKSVPAVTETSHKEKDVSNSSGFLKHDSRSLEEKQKRDRLESSHVSGPGQTTVNSNQRERADAQPQPPPVRRQSQDAPPRRKSQDTPAVTNPPKSHSHSISLNGGSVNPGTVTNVSKQVHSPCASSAPRYPSAVPTHTQLPQAPAPGAYQAPYPTTPPIPSQPINTPPMSPMVCPPAPPIVTPHPIVDYGAPVRAPPPTQFPPVYNPYNSSVVSNSSSGMSPSYSNYPSPPVISPTPVSPAVSGYGATTSPLGYLGAMTPPSSVTSLMPPSPTPKNPRVDYALRTWKNLFGPSSDPVYLSSMELSSKLCELINRGCKPNGERYRADMLLYISLGIQQILRDNKRADKIFYDHAYYNFVVIFTDYAERELAVGIHATIEEIHFWEASELGASSPGVMLFTLIYMFQKYFGLKTWEMQASLNFSHIVVQSRYDQFGRYVKHISLIGLPGAYPTEIPEDLNCPDRCLIKLYEFYCFKNEIRDGPFYKCLRQEYTPRSPWFTNQPLDQRHIYQMLVRATMIKTTNTYS